MMKTNIYKNEFKVKEINSHLRSWENTKKIINNNFIGAFWNSNYTDFRSAFSIFCIWNRYNFVKDTKRKILILQNLLTALIALPTFNVFLLHENINFSDLISNIQSLANKNELKIEELDEITELGKILIYLNFYMKFIQESIQNSCILSGLIYEYCFNTQGTTDFLIDFPKKTQKEKMIHRDFPRAQENADNETKRIITVRQLVAFYDHSWLNSNEPPDEATYKFWIAIDSLLTEEQSNKLSYIINSDPNDLTELERNLREQFFSQDFRNMVINYWKSTFLEVTNFVNEEIEKKNDEKIIKSYKIDSKNLPDKNRFQRIMYLPDNNLTLEERLFRNIFLQEAAEENNSNHTEEIINSLRMPIKIEMPEEFQNMLEVINEVNFNYEIEDDDIYDNFLDQFFEKFVSQDKILPDILNGNCIVSEQEFENITEILFRNYDEEEKKNIILELLSSESKLKVYLKEKLLSGNLELLIEKNSDKIIVLLSLQSKLSYKCKKYLLCNFLKVKLDIRGNFDLLTVVNAERLSMQEKNLILVYEKGSGFLKSCYKDINLINNFESQEEFSQALYFKLNLYPLNTQMKILKLLLSEKSKLPHEIKQSLQINYFELIPGSIKMLARDELTLNRETLAKFYEKLFFICKNDPKKIFNLLKKIVNDNKTIPEFKKIIYQNVNRFLYLFTENENNRQKIFQDMINTLPNKNDFDYSNEFECAAKPLMKNFDKLVL